MKKSDDGRPSRLSLSKRRRSKKYNREQAQKKICQDESSLKNDKQQTLVTALINDTNGQSEINLQNEVIEILSSDEEGLCETLQKFKQSDMLATPSSRSVSTSTSALASSESSNQPNSTLEAGIREEETNVKVPYPKEDVEFTTPKLTYKTSAYTQNLAEISFDILNDARWRSSNKRIFRWELGDDLSMLHSFSRLFILPSGSEAMDAHRDESKIETSTDKEEDEEEYYARSMNLYARMFHRKGPWFHITDIFLKYYHRDYIRRQHYEKSDLDLGNQAERDEDSCIWQKLEKSLNDCMLDICQLVQMGAIRNFSSEAECGEIIGRSDSKLLTEKDKLKVLRKLGGKSSKKQYSISNAPGSTNDILRQMKSQKTMSFQKKGSLLPVRNHLNDVILDDFAAKLNALLPKADTSTRPKSNQDIKAILKRIWKSMKPILGNEGAISTCFRLREKPLFTLRRACRLYLLAGDGPGSMRWNGSNSWISVIETDENFTFQRSKERSMLKGICHMPQPPCAILWHQVDFHGLNHRMGLKYFSCVEKYVRIPANKNNKKAEIFYDLSTFTTWELCVEIRGTLDYLLEWNRLILYADRKVQRNSKKTSGNSVQNFIEELEPCISNEIFDVLSTEGRSVLCSQLARSYREGSVYAIGNENVIHERVEMLIHSLHSNDGHGDGHLEADGHDSFLTDAERMICSIGIICSEVLRFALEVLPEDIVVDFVKRPWLRHLQPESVMAYMVWDAVEVTEKRGYHDIACHMLEIILFGFCMDPFEWKFEYYLQKTKSSIATSRMCQILLSRRVRGKALERLFIDKKHAIRKAQKSKKTKKSVCKVDTFTARCIQTLASSASVPFSFLRKFSRRIKQPLTRSLNGDSCSVEMFELGIRLLDKKDTVSAEQAVTKKELMKDKEWSPSVDVFVANAIRHNTDSGVGRRCAFIGDEDTDGLNHTRSLNVEELAIELYAAGKLPIDENHVVHKDLKGGWKGWHSEGVHVRVLFRVLCAPILLGSGRQSDDEQLSVYLQSYQASPLDLHVAYGNFHGMDSLTMPAKSFIIQSFYERRRGEIEDYFKELEEMSPQELSDLCFQSVSNKIAAVKKLGRKFTNDHILFRDLQQVKTLSMLAAGFGGQQLASMFRLLCFDYRHYGAGLPDLLLVRAYAQDPDEATFQSLDLCQWIGEVFQHSPTCTSAILDDRDEEFIGGTLNERKSMASGKQKHNSDKEQWTLNDFHPERLVLSNEGCPVTVECMFVEVKSENDRLDDRQEDWLNVLDRYGNARLCKFISSSKDTSA